MPRAFLTDRSVECRRRRVKCDGIRPFCSPCQRGARSCEWPASDRFTSSVPVTRLAGPSSNPPLQPAVAAAQSHPHFQHVDFASTRDPELALQDRDVARLFRHYIKNLASWYDLNDRKRHFTDIVPVKARANSLLLSAILAFSAASLYCSDPNETLIEKASFYHLESLTILIRITSSVEISVSDGEALAAICLLRSYEIISRDHKCQSHLQGCHSLLASRPIQLRSDLVSAAFWNYLREDITMALIERRRLMIELSEEHLPEELNDDDDYANYITVLLGQVINYGFRQDIEPIVASSRWSSLKDELEKWKTALPPSFQPILSQEPEGSAPVFPSVWTLHGWHTAALQYYHTAMIILLLGKPVSQPRTALQNMTQINSLTQDLEKRATQVCALAISSDSPSVWINSFGPIAFCGSWLRDQSKLDEVVKEVRNWGAKTGWPVAPITESIVSANSSAAPQLI
ncbi:hypothetical protein F5884DRAFT_790498 [Xylogone sp. PMI_703]|nr:hypothetical protein F5884DRAFT_790498 [Xylogone sp. PMI_703]